ncbi:hypothetical protein BC827DRAFT_1286557 [Russula dissimulans]|nr:hypothetical protein BC827DRAFT_1286557 [Russula dissimulans]
MILIGSEDDKVGEKRVSMFFPSNWENETYAWFLVLTIASAFGGIHCIGWSFAFHSSIDRTLWRVASVSITSIPTALFLPAFLPNLIRGRFKYVTDLILSFFAALELIFMYLVD